MTCRSDAHTVVLMKTGGNTNAMLRDNECKSIAWRVLHCDGGERLCAAIGQNTAHHFDVLGQPDRGYKPMAH
jgi:hypothetical protein